MEGFREPFFVPSPHSKQQLQGWNFLKILSRRILRKNGTAIG